MAIWRLGAQDALPEFFGKGRVKFHLRAMNDGGENAIRFGNGRRSVAKDFHQTLGCIDCVAAVAGHLHCRPANQVAARACSL